MKKEDAWKILAQVVAQYKGTLDEHKTIQEALAVLKPEEKVVD